MFIPKSRKINCHKRCKHLFTDIIPDKLGRYVFAYCNSCNSILEIDFVNKSDERVVFNLLNFIYNQRSRLSLSNPEINAAYEKFGFSSGVHWQLLDTRMLVTNLSKLSEIIEINVDRRRKMSMDDDVVVMFEYDENGMICALIYIFDSGYFNRVEILGSGVCRFDNRQTIKKSIIFLSDPVLSSILAEAYARIFLDSPIVCYSSSYNLIVDHKDLPGRGICVIDSESHDSILFAARNDLMVVPESCIEVQRPSLGRKSGVTSKINYLKDLQSKAIPWNMYLLSKIKSNPGYSKELLTIGLSPSEINKIYSISDKPTRELISISSVVSKKTVDVDGEQIDATGCSWMSGNRLIISADIRIDEVIKANRSVKYKMRIYTENGSTTAYCFSDDDIFEIIKSRCLFDLSKIVTFDSRYKKKALRIAEALSIPLVRDGLDYVGYDDVEDRIVVPGLCNYLSSRELVEEDIIVIDKPPCKTWQSLLENKLVSPGDVETWLPVVSAIAQSFIYKRRETNPVCLITDYPPVFESLVSLARELDLPIHKSIGDAIGDKNPIPKLLLSELKSRDVQEIYQSDARDGINLICLSDPDIAFVLPMVSRWIYLNKRLENIKNVATVIVKYLMDPYSMPARMTSAVSAKGIVLPVYKWCCSRPEFSGLQPDNGWIGINGDWVFCGSTPIVKKTFVNRYIKRYASHINSRDEIKDYFAKKIKSMGIEGHITAPNFDEIIPDIYM